MISIIEVQLSDFVPNECSYYYISENHGKYTIDWMDGNRRGSSTIINSNDIHGTRNITMQKLPIMYCDGVITWEDVYDYDSCYEDDETSVFYNHEESDYYSDD